MFIDNYKQMNSNNSFLFASTNKPIYQNELKVLTDKPVQYLHSYCIFITLNMFFIQLSSAFSNID